MARYSFLDDYSEGCHPEILAALSDTNRDQQLAYGNDEFSQEARMLVARECGDPELPVFFVSGGTLANLIVISAALRSHEAVIAATSGHISLRETGAIEATGHKVITVPSTDGRVSVEAVDAAVAANAQGPHMAKPRMLYLSNATELGTVYSLGELEDLRAVCDRHRLLMFVDGARLGVALASDRADGLTLEGLASLADVFWIGGTKAGTLFGEAIVLPDRALAADFDYHLKQRGALLAKGRSLGQQFRVLFGHGLFATASRAANNAANRLSSGLVSGGAQLAAPTESNQVFAILGAEQVDRLQREFSFYPWEQLDDGRVVVRLVTSWATDPDQVERFIEVAGG